MFIPVTTVEQAVALRREGLLYFRNSRGGWEHLPPSSDFPSIVRALGNFYVIQRYAYYLED